MRFLVHLVDPYCYISLVLQLSPLQSLLRIHDLLLYVVSFFDIEYQVLQLLLETEMAEIDRNSRNTYLTDAEAHVKHRSLTF